MEKDKKTSKDFGYQPGPAAEYRLMDLDLR
jgi:hypothetical protein